MKSFLLAAVGLICATAPICAQERLGRVRPSEPSKQVVVGENDTTKELRKLNNPTRRFLLMTMLDDEPCGFVTDAVYHTGAKDSVNLWSARCSNRKRYAVIVEPYGHMSGRPLTCAELEEFASLLAEPAGEPGDAWHCSPVIKTEASLDRKPNGDD